MMNMEDEKVEERCCYAMDVPTFSFNLLVVSLMSPVYTH